MMSRYVVVQMWRQTTSLLEEKMKLKLKKLPQGQTVKPFAVEKRKDQQILERFQIALPNRFTSLEQANDCREQWEMLEEFMTSVAEETQGKRRPKQKEMWIKKERGN